MKIEMILEQLCNHEMSKAEAAGHIREITEGMRKKGSTELKVNECHLPNTNSHGELKLGFSYSEEKFLKGLKRGDKVDLTILP